MRKDGWILRALYRALLLLAIVIPAASVGADDEKAKEAEAAEADRAAAETVRRYARERLLQRARDTVDPSRHSAGELDVLKGSLLEKDKTKHISELDPTRWAEVIKLLGPLEVEGTKGDGLIRQGAIFYRWMDGKTLEKPTLYFRDSSVGQRGVEVQVLTEMQATDAPDAEPVPTLPEFKRVTEWMVDGPRVPSEVLVHFKLDVVRDPAPDRDREVLAGGMDRLRRVQPPLASIALTRPDEFHFVICRTYLKMRQRQVDARVAKFKADIPSAGLVSAPSVRTREERAEKLREKVNRVVAIQRGVEGSLDRLAREDSKLRRASGSLGFEIDEARRAFEEFRKKRDEEQAAAEKAAAEAAAAEKKAAAEKAAAEKAAAEKADGEAGEEGEADGTGGEGEEGDPPPSEEAAPEGAGPGLDDAEEPAASEEEMDATEKTLERLRLREILDAQKLRLLYIAVRRAELRGALLEGILHQVKAEAVAAEDAAERFQIELATKRREGQMDRLAFEGASMKLAHALAHKNANEGTEIDRPVWGAYDTALEALMVVNAATVAAVEMRRSLEVRTKPIDRSFNAQALDIGAAAAGAGVAGGSLEEGCLTPEETRTFDENDPLKRFRSCRAASLDAAYVRDAMGALDHPDWDAEMTAVHYEAVDDRIMDLESAREIIQLADSLQERYDTAHAGAVTALSEVGALGQETGSGQRSTWKDRLQVARREWLVPNEKAFRGTMRAITDEFEQVAADIDLYRSFRGRLLQLGPRSFRVRLQRKLDTEQLATAYGEALVSVRGAGRWLSFQGEEHFGTFVTRNWPKLLACLGVLMASLFVVRYGRRGLDAALRRMARSVDALQAEPVTVGAEEAQARRESVLSEAAARAEEEAALREVSKEEAGKSQRMGEGGYSAEADA